MCSTLTMQHRSHGTLFSLTSASTPLSQSNMPSSQREVPTPYLHASFAKTSRLFCGNNRNLQPLAGVLESIHNVCLGRAGLDLVVVLPTRALGHRHEDRLDTTTSFETEDGAAVVHEVEFNIASAPHLLPFLLLDRVFLVLVLLLTTMYICVNIYTMPTVSTLPTRLCPKHAYTYMCRHRQTDTDRQTQTCMENIRLVCTSQTLITDG